MGNKEIVLKAMNELFHEKDSTAIERYWHESYQQHNPSMINGHEGLKKLLPFLDSNFKWQPGIMVEENDLVITHSLVNGWGAVPVIVVDIFRLKDGKIAEHWDVVQEEVPASKSANGNAMTSFNSTNKKNKLTGNRYIMDVGVLKTELYFETEESLIFTVIEGGSLTENGYSERVKATIAEIRPNVYMVAWKEISGATVTHVEDHQNSIIYSNATVPDGSFYTMKGTIKPV